MADDRRFLRDMVLDQMLRELRDVQQMVEEQRGDLACNLNPILEASVELYETNRIVLKHIEAAIETVRERDEGVYLDDLTIAAAHLRIGMTGLHSALVATAAVTSEEDESGENTLHIETEE